MRSNTVHLYNALTEISKKCPIVAFGGHAGAAGITIADENIDLFNFIEFKNKVPVKVKYKNINLLGDKLTLGIAKNETAQKLAFLCLSVGLGEMNARGFSYMNPRWV